GLEFETESVQAGLGAQPPLPNVCPNFDENITILGEYYKAGGAGNLLSLKKLKSYYAYKLEKVLSDGTAVAAKKKKGLTARYGGTALLDFREALNNYKREDTSECDLLKKTIEQMKAEIELKRVVDKQYALEFADLSRYWSAKIWWKKNTSLEAELRQKSGLGDSNQSLSVELNKKCKEIESLKVVNALLMEQIDLQFPPATSLAMLQSHQPVPDTTLAKKYEDLLVAHEDIKKKLIAKEDFEVWRQALKKVLASEGMGDMGDPTFEEFFEQNERFFTIAQQGPKGDY
ncbi:hypothetical protein GIB67_039206, partial [Kingdonia uniflora]